MRWPWRKHVPSEDDQAAREAAEESLAHARKVSGHFDRVTDAITERLEQNGFGAAVAASMQPKRRRLPWDR
jgi:hypothetical protein